MKIYFFFQKERVTKETCILFEKYLATGTADLMTMTLPCSANYDVVSVANDDVLQLQRRRLMIMKLIISQPIFFSDLY